MNDSIMYQSMRHNHSLFLLASVVNKNEVWGADKRGREGEGRNPKIKDKNLKLVT